ncbi:hypothetical protein K488DRAFT_71151 [Vararia minispora EC-137]|uniref:Uncharacterized protein n=1 Tax=Vararia minispora EC-137 TaxID=1314806 RepID=A0ACB8QJ99_9AGAM|nr:hypothetical protein K488DRAFT_71151 [Vararia minispora EC-137]
MAEADNAIILYDGFRDVDVFERPSSTKVLMVRLALCVKGIPHTTSWIDWPDIAAEATKIGASPTGERDGKPRYTVPFIYDPTTRIAISDSQKIILYLEGQYPDSPRLFPPGTRALQAAFVQSGGPHSVESRILEAAAPIYRGMMSTLTPLAQEYVAMLHKHSAAGEHKNRMDTDGGEVKIVEVLEVLNEVDGWFREGEADGPGDFLTGGAPCNADVTLAATLISVRNVGGDDSNLWQAILAANGGRWARYMELFKAWYKVV